MNCYEDLKDKKVLVTGASRGIGAGIVKAFSQAGAKVFLHYRTDQNLAEKIASELPGEVHLFRADLGKAEELEALFEAVKAEFGTLDAAVNNAGVVLPALAPEEITDEYSAGNRADAQIRRQYHQYRFSSSGYHCPRLDIVCYEQGGHSRHDRTARHTGGQKRHPGQQHPPRLYRCG